MQKKYITVTSLLKTLNLSTSKGTAWKSESIPKYDILKSIAEYFEVSVSYLFEEENEQNDFSSRQTNYGNVKGDFTATMNVGNNAIQYDETTSMTVVKNESSNERQKK